VTIADVVAEAIYQANIKPAEELAPFRTWDELTERGRGYWRHLAQAAIDAILSEVTRVDVIEPPGLAGCRDHWADSPELRLPDDGRTEWDS
jgi:hypothetical protein